MKFCPYDGRYKILRTQAEIKSRTKEIGKFMAKGKKVQVSFVIDSNLLAELDKTADECCISRSQLLGNIIAAGIKMDKAFEEAGVFEELFGEGFIDKMAEKIMKEKKGK